jgi:hypothetical protein
MSLRAIARQSRRMQGGHALATRLPRRYAPRNDIMGYDGFIIYSYFFSASIEKSSLLFLIILANMPSPVISISTRSLGCSHWGW